MKKQMKKRTMKMFAVLLSVIMILSSMTGCSSDKEKDKQETQKVTETVTKQPEPTKEDVLTENQSTPTEAELTPTDEESYANDPTVEPTQEVVVENENEEYTPVKIDNYERTIEFSEKPDGIVALTLNSAEIVAALGEAESIKGIAQNNNVVKDVLPDLYPLLSKCDFPAEINSGIPTLEGMLGLSPKLVIANSYYFRVPQIFGSLEDYQANGVEFYITEGSYLPDCTIENTYNDIRNIGAILNKQDEAEKIITNMKQRMEDVSKKVADQTPVSVMSFDSFDEDGFTVSGGKGLVQNLISLAGGNNAFADAEGQFVSVNIEEIITRNPDVIVIHAYTAMGDEDTQAKIDKLKNTPELSEVNAIKNNNIIVVPLFQVNPGLQNVNYVESLAAVMYPELFEN